MAQKVTNWLYPINPEAGFWFVDDRGRKIRDPITNEAATTAGAFWESVKRGSGHRDRWLLSTGFRKMQAGDRLWVYAGGSSQSIVGLGRVNEVRERSSGWQVYIDWDKRATRELKKNPIPRTKFHDIPQSVRRPSPKTSRFLDNWFSQYSSTEVLEDVLPPPFELASKDARKIVLRQLAQRQGQKKFRESLIAAYKGACAVTGCKVEQTLEAAHIWPYKGPKSNDVRNGMLLRADIHSLFDQRLIRVDANYEIVMDSVLRNTVYAKYEGKTIRLPSDPECRPSTRALAMQFKQPKRK